VHAALTKQSPLVSAPLFPQQTATHTAAVAADTVAAVTAAAAVTAGSPQGMSWLGTSRLLLCIDPEGPVYDITEVFKCKVRKRVTLSHYLIGSHLSL